MFLTLDTPILPFKESNEILDQPDRIRKRMRFEGYLFFRNLISRDKVMAVRHGVVQACREAGWLKADVPPEEAITDHPPVMEGDPEWEPVYEKVQKMESFHRLAHEPAVVRVIEAIFEEPVFRLPMTIARIALPDNERATPPQQDYFYVKGSTETISCWTPLGNVPAEIGGLVLQEGSHKSGVKATKKHPGVGGNTIDVDPALPWRGTDFRAGDVLFFHCLTTHAARPSLSKDRLRFSLDFRYVGLSHSVSDSWLLPHFYWLGPRFSWDNLDKGWDPSFRRYWEPVQGLKIQPQEGRLYAKE